ncbi:MAG: hypothetical protein J5792_00110 [Bacteroidales bacterium]|nr:hypothetical protein [Bacteroidales bacterium]
MKRLVLLLFCVCGSVCMTQAQVGSLLQKAAKKAVEKTTDKVIDKTTDAAADAASKAVEKQVDKVLPSSYKNNTSSQSASQSGNQSDVQSDEPLTYSGVMGELPELPTVDQYLNYKSSELKDQKLKLLGSPVFAFNSKATLLAVQAAGIAYQDLDSAQLMEAAYKNAEAYTGLSKAELEKLSTMSEEEQEAYLQTHYQQGKAEAAAVKQAEDASKYLEPLQPQIDRWEAVNEKIEELYSQSEEKCKAIYKKYSDRLAKSSEAGRNDILLSYYAEILPIRRQAVQQALQIRLKEQLPIAEEIEKEMVKIRATHQDMISMLLNYPQLTSTSYFAEVARLMEIPEYSE